jgi:signal transduction histidine kinase
MRHLRHSVLPVLISLLAFAFAYVLLSIDFKIGKYQLSSDSLKIEQTEGLLPLYNANFGSLKNTTSKSIDDRNNEIDLYQVSRELSFEDLTSEALTYYAPNLENDALLILNSVLVSDQNIVPRNFQSPILKPKQILVDIPRNFIFPDDNLLSLVMPSRPNFKGLNREYLGPRSEIREAFQAQSIIQTWLPPVTLSMCLTLTIAGLIGLLFSSARLTYLIAITTACLVSLYCIVAGNSPLSDFIGEQNWLHIVSPIIFLSLFMCLWMSVRAMDRDLTSLGLGLLGFAFTGPGLALLLLSFKPLFLDEIFVSHLFLISSLPLLIYIIVRFTSSDLSAYGSKITALRQTIGAQKIELDEKSAIIAEEMRQRAILEERQRMMRDIHDGIGGQLLSLLLRVRTGSLEQGEVATEIQSSLKDLRLVVDSIDQFGGDFASALATFRSRAEQQMAAARIRLIWHQAAKDIQRNFSAGQTLQLYRFMQEVLTNIIRHSKATEASVHIVTDPKTRSLEIIIEDNGIGLPKPEVIKAGKGLKNLEARAQNLKAIYAIGPVDIGSGTRVSLMIPPEN